MVSGEAHSLPSAVDVQAMSEDERMAVVDTLLANLSATRLETVGAKVQQARQERLAAEQKAFEARVAPLQKEAELYGLVLILQPKITGKSGARKSKPKSETPTPLKGRKYPPGIYRNPETGEEWHSGGRPPKGIREAVAMGHDPREFLVRPLEGGEGQRETESKQPQEDSEVS